MYDCTGLMKKSLVEVIMKLKQTERSEEKKKVEEEEVEEDQKRPALVWEVERRERERE